jgi:hypothetical protein
MQAINLNTEVATWLKFAFCQIGQHLVTSGPIIIICLVVAFAGIGIGWGKLWNVDWKIGSVRGLVLSAFSLIASFSLAGVDSLYGGNFFNQDLKMGLDSNINLQLKMDDAEDGSGKVYNLAKQINGMNQNKGLMDEEENVSQAPVFVFTDTAVSNYFNALILLWGVVGACFIGMLILIPYCAYNEIKKITPLAF